MNSFNIFTHINSITAILSLLGNGTVLAVNMWSCSRRQCFTARNMQLYVINLAVSDLLAGVLCVPFSYVDMVLGYWVFPHWLCFTAQFVQLLSAYVTAMTLTIIGVER